MADVQPSGNGSNRADGHGACRSRDASSAIGDQFADLTDAAGEKIAAASTATKDTAVHAADSFTTAVRKRPVTSLVVATGVGVGLALLLTSARREPQRGSYARYRERMPEFSGADLREMSHTIQNAVRSAAPRERASSLGNSLVEALNDTQARDMLSQASSRALQLWDEIKHRAGRTF